MGLLAKARQKRKERFDNEFISLFDSVMYLGEPLDEALTYIIECIPHQAKLYLTSDGCQAVFFGYDEVLWGDDNLWNFNGVEIYHQELIRNLSNCIKQKHIEPTNPIYNLGFGKKRFLSYLVADGFEVEQRDLLTALSPTPIVDDYEDLDCYTVASIINERDELRKLVDELKKQGKPKQITPQGDDLLILGAVMGTLADKTVNPYTQTLLIEKIIEKFGNIKGISKSTLDKKFAESKEYIKQENEILL